MPNHPRTLSRREAIALTAVCVASLPSLGCTSGEAESSAGVDSPDSATKTIPSDSEPGNPMQVHYLEIVTKDVEASCALHSAIHGTAFSDADPSLGGARTVPMPNGGMVGIRAPMHDGEKPVTRAYILVKDIESAVAAAEEAGAVIAVPPMKIPGHGACAIFIQDGIESGFWQI